MYGLREFELQKYPIPFNDSPGLGRFNCYGFPIPYRMGNRTLGDVTASSLTAGVQSFGTGALASPWLYVGLGLLGVYLYKSMGSGPKRRRRKRGVITPLTAGVYAAGAGAGGYLLGKYSGL